MRQGRTDAWIAHKLDVSVQELEQFKRDHRVDGDPAPASAEPVSADQSSLEELEQETDLYDAGEDDEEEEEEEEPAEPPSEKEEGEEEEGPSRRRRRGRRGGRRRGKRPPVYEATFDHGEEGYGLWLDPAVADSDVYSDHWAGHREVAVTIEPDAITIRRAAQGD